MRDPELDATLDSLKAAQGDLVKVLLLAAQYLEELAVHDERAAFLVGLIDRAFDALQAENIGAHSVLAEKRRK